MHTFSHKLSALALLAAAATSGQVSAQQISNCPVFPADNVWNTPVSQLPVDQNSDAYLATIGTSKPLHPDFGSQSVYGIPYMVVPSTQPKVNVTFQYADESDKGPYPIPANAPVEGGPNGTGDRHVLILQKKQCILYELFGAYPLGDGSWKAGSGAIWRLASDQLRPLGWTSADAAGLPILPGLVRYDEVASGAIKHAIRFTVPQTRRAYVWPSEHFASNFTETKFPPMGQRFRLRASFDISTYSLANQVILKALKEYGMILADNGSSLYISGTSDSRFNDSDLHNLTKLHGSDFEAVNESSLMVSPTSGQAKH